MLIIETSIFTRQITELVSEDSYREFQLWLVKHPDAGALIRGAGGCRKVRWMSAHAGKRGGIRVIYYWMSRADRILMLMAYPKSAREDLTPWQVKVLGKLVKQELQGAEDG